MAEMVSKCVLRVEVKNSTANAAESGGAAGATATDNNSKKQQRTVSEVSVETFASRLSSPRDDWGILPVESREPCTPTGNHRGKPLLSDADDPSEIGFFSGNPFVEVTDGILHLYKEDTLTSREDASTLCLLGVPNSMTCRDLLAFTAPCHAEISHMRVLRDDSPNQYMALLTFRTYDAAREFYETFDGAPFNSLEVHRVCRAVWVSRVEWAHDGVPPPGHTELPTCPVCLERMDESVDGVLTILCNHSFHADCLEQWSDSTCPVCRCVQSPEQAESSECERCGRTLGPSPDALWICLICGHVGCGRYQGGHAASHYRESGHCYALQLGSHRVWDYKGDNFVHRLLQNKADGKLVPSEEPPTSESGCNQEKVDAVQLEFSYLLTSQLDEQRLYFEEKLALADGQLALETKALRDKVTALAEENERLKTELGDRGREKATLDKKLMQMSTRLNATLHDLSEEKQLGKALRTNQQQWQSKVSKLETSLTNLKEEKEQQVAELKEQLRDVMFYIEARQEIAKSEDRIEIAGGTVTIGEAPATAGSSHHVNKGRRKKK